MSENTMNKEILFLKETLKTVEVTPETKADIEFKKKKLDLLKTLSQIICMIV